MRENSIINSFWLPLNSSILEIHSWTLNGSFFRDKLFTRIKKSHKIDTVSLDKCALPDTCKNSGLVSMKEGVILDISQIVENLSGLII